MRPILEETGLKAGKDFFLAYSPEREDPTARTFLPPPYEGCRRVFFKLP